MGIRRSEDQVVVAGGRRRSFTPMSILGLDPSALKVQGEDGSLPGYAIPCNKKTPSRTNISVVESSVSALKLTQVHTRGYTTEKNSKVTRDIIHQIIAKDEEVFVELRMQQIRLAVLEVNKPAEGRRRWRSALRTRAMGSSIKLNAEMYLQWWRSAYYTSGKDVYNVILEDIATQTFVKTVAYSDSCQTCFEEQPWICLKTNRSHGSSLADIWAQGHTNVNSIMVKQPDVVVGTLVDVHNRPLLKDNTGPDQHARCKECKRPHAFRQRSSDIMQGARLLRSKVSSGKRRMKQWSIARRPSLSSRDSL